MAETDKKKTRKNINEYYLQKDLNLSENAIKVLQRRYLKRDEEGNLLEQPVDMFVRVARNIASAEKKYGKSEKHLFQPSGARFPANICVSDDVLNDGVEYSSNWKNTDKPLTTTWLNTQSKNGQHYNDSGSFSRYFSLDSWAQKHLPASVLKTFPFLLVPKASKGEKTAGGRVENKHPTVKPVKLLAYLITMGSRPEN